MASIGAAALALSWSPPAPASADLLSPSPTPCSLPPPLTCAVPTPPAVVTSSPSPQPVSKPPSGGGTAPPAGTVTPPKTSGGGSSTGALSGGVSLADVAVLQTTLGSSALVEQLVAILQNPLAAQRPDLLHFELAGAAGSGHPAAARDAAPLAAALAILLLWMAAAPLLRLNHAVGRPIVAAAAIAPAVLVAAVLAPPLSAPPRPAPHLLSARAPAPATWRELVAVESTLARDRSSLAALESRLERLTAELGQEQPGTRVQPHVFETLAALHDAAAGSYDRDLQQEYDLYLSAAQQPAVSGELRRAAAASGHTAALKAVDANLQTVATQLQQESAIQQAQQRLQQLGFTPAQAEALQSHDAFVAPLGGPIGQPFGPTSFALEPPLVYQGQFYPHFHTGIDIEAPLGAPVVAAADGVVALVATSTDGHGHTTGYGTYVVIAHAHGYYTLYAHLSGVLVTAGQLVHQGQPVGLVGVTGNSTGPHLHFEIRRDGQFLDPLPYVTGRLKPW